MDFRRRKRQQEWISYVLDVLIKPTIGQVISFQLLGFIFFLRKAIEPRRSMLSYCVRDFMKHREDEIASSGVVLCYAGFGKYMLRQKDHLTFAILWRQAACITLTQSDKDQALLVPVKHFIRQIAKCNLDPAVP